MGAKLMRRSLYSAALWLLLTVLGAGSAAAQTAVSALIPNGYQLVAVVTGSLAISPASVTTPLSPPVPIVWVTNQGANPACITLGAASITANWPCAVTNQVAPGTTAAFAIGSSSTLAAATQSGNTSLGLIQGYTQPYSPGGSLIGSTITWKQSNQIPTVQAAQYVSGNNIGGLIAFTLDRTASGLLQTIDVQFVGGATTPITWYCFSQLPSNASTFTDRSTFSIAAADEAKRINKVGIPLTPAASTGDTVTGVALDNYARPFNSTGTIWCAGVVGGTFTPASPTDMRVAIGIGQGAL
jgi:hypothetical protein